MTLFYHLRCVSCRQEFQPGTVDYTCPSCGPIRGTREVLYDFDRVRRHLSKDSLAKQSFDNHWRYLPLLPIDSPELILPLAVGGTPLYKADKLASQWDMNTVWIKDDSRNPTASLKDRASSVAVVKAQEKEARAVTAASTGNAASSWSAFTALAGLDTYIFVPETAPRAKVAQLLLYGAHVIQVQGSYDDAFDLCCRAAEKWGWYNRSTSINPYLGEGKKTAALEICEQLDWQVPDYIFVSVGDGCIFQGMWKGFSDFYELGFIDRLPKMIGVQAAGSAPLVTAWENGAEVSEPIQAETVADSISVGIPRDQVKALRAARASDGKFIAVSDEEILAAIPTLARQSGVFAEPAGATALAGAWKMRQSGALKSGDRILIMVTGHGLKDIEGVMKAVSQKPIVVENDLAAVEQAVQQ